jgi:hypothetical protein
LQGSIGQSSSAEPARRWQFDGESGDEKHGGSLGFYSFLFGSEQDE